MQNPLQALLELADEEKDVRGLRYTPREISQQPDSWQATYQKCRGQQVEISSFLKSSGIARGPGSTEVAAPTVYLVGAGTSDYIGRAVADVLRLRWLCPVWAIPSTDLLTNLDNLVLEGRDYLGFLSPGPAIALRALPSSKRRWQPIPTCGILLSLAIRLDEWLSSALRIPSKRSLSSSTMPSTTAVSP